jgi:hypothetical protein
MFLMFVLTVTDDLRCERRKSFLTEWLKASPAFNLLLVLPERNF